jgi:hypothetical protein
MAAFTLHLSGMLARRCERRCRKKKRIVYFMKTFWMFKILVFWGGSSLGAFACPYIFSEIQASSANPAALPPSARAAFRFMVF